MSVIASISTLKARLSGTVYTPGEDGYAAELAGFNTAARHTPEIVVRVECADDITECVRFARVHGLRVSVQGAGHGGITPIRSGLLVSTKSLTTIAIDEHARIANVGAGARFGSLVSAATQYGLLPISGSSADVGVVGYLLGGGLGPLSRSHGFSSDYVESFLAVTAKGERVTADAAENQDLYWALRGGKGHGLAIVTELRLRLVELRTLYAGSLAFDESQIPAALTGYLAWTESADPRVTTSVAIIRYPEIDAVPEALRGRCILQLRFAFPGPTTEGAELAAPLRAIAPIYVDALGELRAADIARIHNDPSEPMPSRVGAMLLACRGPELLSPLLEQCGPGVDTPFVAAELRHLGNATHRDAPGGSAVGGRKATFALGFIATNPDQFEHEVADAEVRFRTALESFSADEHGANFLGHVRSAEHFASGWSPATLARLAEVSARYDPERVFNAGFE